MSVSVRFAICNMKRSLLFLELVNLLLTKLFHPVKATAYGCHQICIQSAYLEPVVFFVRRGANFFLKLHLH